MEELKDLSGMTIKLNNTDKIVMTERGAELYVNRELIKRYRKLPLIVETDD